jgi:Rad3-related DNA helicase
MDIIDHISDHFPMPTYRTNQKETLQQIEEAIASDYKVISLQAPTGSGKSAINFSVCGFVEKSYYTTPLHILLDQVVRDKFLLNLFKIVRGRDWYICLEKCSDCHKYNYCKERETGVSIQCEHTCDIGPCQLQKEYKCGKSCFYKKARDDAIESQTALMSLAYNFTIKVTKGMWQKRDMLIIDEAHGVEKWILNFITLSRVFQDIKHADAPTTFDESLNLINKEVDIAASEVADLEEQQKSLGGLRPQDLKKYKRLVRFIDIVHVVVHDLEAGKQWVHNVTKLPENKVRVELKPLDISVWGKGLLLGKANRFLFSSGYIPRNMYKRIGFTDDEVAWIDVPSTFPVENRPIIGSMVGYISHKTMDNLRPRIIEVVNKILDKEKDIRGFIHCNSYKLANDILGNLTPDNKSRVKYNTSENRSYALESWLNDGLSNSVFCGVNMSEGIDLKDDLSRFQIIIKAPFPDMSDSYVKARMGLSDGKPWYDEQALMAILQAYGRCVRSESDWARTYILDWNVMRLINTYKNELPGWFVEAFKAAKSETFRSKENGSNQKVVV